jgi:hypothetical protein
MLLGLLALIRAPVELAEAEVAVGEEGAHAKMVGATSRLPIEGGKVLRRTAQMVPGPHSKSSEQNVSGRSCCVELDWRSSRESPANARRR